eukprot:PLAT317.1.p1 GENE.PLAT317.1~~PLAT317.1.p1  ORF type:complete len:256 (-),score=117.21 PLAT317.1:231-998(-)
MESPMDMPVDTAKQYWKTISKRGDSAEVMMLCVDAKTLDERERTEIMSYMPDLAGKRVLELGAGAGRMTRELAAAGAARVAAYDFTEAFVSAAVERFADMPSVVFELGDARTMQPRDEDVGTYDLLFTNWLLMYFVDDADVRRFGERASRWLRPGGHLFIRESCFHRSGDMPVPDNPTVYRRPDEYMELLLTEESKLEVACNGRIETYAELKNNPNQRWWLFRRKSDDDVDAASSSSSSSIVVDEEGEASVVEDA